MYVNEINLALQVLRVDVILYVDNEERKSHF